MRIRLHFTRNYDLGYLIDDYREFFREFTFATISSIDSGHEVSAWLPARLQEQEEQDWSTVGRCTVVRSSGLIRLVDSEYFIHYDEVWFSNQLPQAEVPLMSRNPFPRGWLVGPNEYVSDMLTGEVVASFIDRVERVIDEDALQWFADSPFLLGMGDGNGLLSLYKEPLILPWAGERGNGVPPEK